MNNECKRLGKLFLCLVAILALLIYANNYEGSMVPKDSGDEMLSDMDLLKSLKGGSYNSNYNYDEPALKSYGAMEDDNLLEFSKNIH